jgi:hypothetical protein
LGLCSWWNPFCGNCGWLSLFCNAWGEFKNIINNVSNSVKSALNWYQSQQQVQAAVNSGNRIGLFNYIAENRAWISAQGASYVWSVILLFAMA